MTVTDTDVYRPVGMPPGWMYPNFQAAKMLTNSKIENPTRMASALNIREDFRWSFLLPRIMKNKALARLLRMTTKPKMTRYFMLWIIP